MRTTSSASFTTQSGIVSRTLTPVISRSWSFRLSRCWTFIVVRTSMPASRSTTTSSHRLALSEPGTFVCGNSSTAQTSGRLARIASVSISSKEWSRYSMQRRGTTSIPSALAIVSCRPCGSK